MPYSNHLSHIAQWYALGHWDYLLRVQAWELINGQKCVTDQGNILWEAEAAMNAAWDAYLSDFGGETYAASETQLPNYGAVLPLPESHSQYETSRTVPITVLAGTECSLIIEIDLILPPGEPMRIDETFVFDAVPAHGAAQLEVALFRE